MPRLPPPPPPPPLAQPFTCYDAFWAAHCALPYPPPPPLPIPSALPPLARGLEVEAGSLSLAELGIMSAEEEMSNAQLEYHVSLLTPRPARPAACRLPCRLPPALPPALLPALPPAACPATCRLSPALPPAACRLPCRLPCCLPCHPPPALPPAACRLPCRLPPAACRLFPVPLPPTPVLPLALLHQLPPPSSPTRHARPPNPPASPARPPSTPLPRPPAVAARQRGRAPPAGRVCAQRAAAGV